MSKHTGRYACRNLYKYRYVMGEDISPDGGEIILLFFLIWLIIIML